MNYELERRVALEAVVKACRLCSAVQAAHLAGGVIDKEDKSPVTVADFGAQAVVSDHLAAVFPGMIRSWVKRTRHFCGSLKMQRLKETVLKHVRMITPRLKEKEIFAAIDRGNAEGGPIGRFWTLDPIDGTKGFLRGDQYAVALALVEDGQVRLGVLGCPSLPLAFSSGAGRFAFRRCPRTGLSHQGISNELKKEKSEWQTLRDPSDALFCESFESSHSSHDDMGEIVKLLGVKRPPLRMDSQVKYGILARGDGNVYLRLPTKKAL